MEAGHTILADDGKAGCVLVQPPGNVEFEFSRQKYFLQSLFAGWKSLGQYQFLWCMMQKRKK